MGDENKGAQARSSNVDIETLRQQLIEIPPADNIVGDLNCTREYKRRALLDEMTRRGLTEKPISGKTWRRWHQPQQHWVESKPDVVFSTGNWTLNTEWTTSDHAIISGGISTQLRKRTDWEAWSDFVEDEEKEATYQDPIGDLRAMAKDKLKARNFSPKPWWDAEIKEQRKATRIAGRSHGEWRKEAAKLRNMIKQKKREHWSLFLEETVSDIWQVIRVARNPFSRRSTMLASLDNNETDESKAQSPLPGKSCWS